MRFHTIWPENRYVSEEQIRSWYADAVANGETELTELRDPEDMAHELSWIGVITLGHRHFKSGER
jgi:hypothetical protein